MLDVGGDLGGTLSAMNLDDVDRELESLGATPSSLPIERIGDLATVDAVLAALGEGVVPPVSSAGSTSSPVKQESASAPATPASAKPASAKPAPAKSPAPPKPPAPARPPAPKSAMPPPPPKSVMPRVAEPAKAPDSSTRQVVAPPPSSSAASAPSSSGTLDADDLFADLAVDDGPSAPSEPAPSASVSSETASTSETAETSLPSRRGQPPTSSPLAELFSDLDEEVAEVGGLFEEESPSEERLSLELGDFELEPSTGTSPIVLDEIREPEEAASGTSASDDDDFLAGSAGSSDFLAGSAGSADFLAGSAGSAADFLAGSAGSAADFEEPPAESTSLFSAADVAAIRRASSVPAPMPPPSSATSVAPPAPPSAAASPLDELVLEDDFELLIDDEDEDDADSTFVGQADEIEELTELRSSTPGEDAPAEAEEAGDEDPDPSGKKGGFFKKLFG